MENKKTNITLIVIIIILLCIVGFLLYIHKINKDNLPINDSPIVKPDVEEIEYEKISTDNLTEVINKLDFENKTTDTATEEEYYVKADIIDNKLVISYNIWPSDDTKTEPVKYSYTSNKIIDPISVHVFFSVQGEGGSIIYVLTKDNKLYEFKWEDFDDVRNNNTNKLDNFEQITTLKVEAIAKENDVVKTALGETVYVGSTSIVFKTLDGNYYTNFGGSEANTSGIVQIINK